MRAQPAEAALLCAKLRWCEIAERRVRPHLVVVAPPGLDLLPRVGQIEEPFSFQTLVAELADNGTEFTSEVMDQCP